MSTTDLHTSYFSQSYGEARTRFMQAGWELRKQGIQSQAFELEIASSLSTKLFADALYFPSSAKKEMLFVMSSGVHGPEAPLGSALQLYFLRRILPRLHRAGLGILLIHSLNPYGFLTGRRSTENNVDLNRNFLSCEEDFQRMSNPYYDKYRQTLAPMKGVRNFFWDSIQIALDIVYPALRDKKSKRELAQALAGGQYLDPKGIYYGGKTFEPQVPWVNKLFTETFPGHEEILFYDVHTGLGKAAALQLIPSLETRLDSPELQKLMSSLEGERDIFLASPHSEGFYITSGDFVDFTYTKAALHGAKALSFTAEFGTLGMDLYAQLSTTLRIILENRGHQWGFSSRSLEWLVRKSFSDLFNPPNSGWKERSLSLGLRVLEGSLKDYLRASDPQHAEVKS